MELEVISYNPPESSQLFTKRGLKTEIERIYKGNPGLYAQHFLIPLKDRTFNTIIVEAI